MKNFVRRAILLAMAVGVAGGLSARSLTTLASAPVPGPDDLFQLSTSGNLAWPDGINCFTDSSAPAVQTFTTGAGAMELTSFAIRTAGSDPDGGYRTPGATPTNRPGVDSLNGNSQRES